uniref:Uncharacterized protein n=1 Tax=Tetraselmis chuii TaxID=63592 RepID=A0A6U1L091_9CHLO|mmetsp:Transcript_7521/g.13551  ORF Transcript_7521/g.13551 Transcript_7521/m.13551 type:complete len:110 (+) Transcript_7521:226-555(+)
MSTRHGSRAALRSLLRTVNRHLTSATGNPTWRNYVVSEFRKNADVADPQAASRLVAKAESYDRLLRAVHVHKDTLLSYNISIGADLGQQQKVERTAARVGFRMPITAPP